MPTRKPLTLPSRQALFVPGLLGLALVASMLPSPGAEAAPKAKRVELAQCGSKIAAARGTGATGDPKARAAAQKGLNFLQSSAPAWQASHNCYGCHVQAVTLEAFVVGHHNQYAVSNKAMKAIVNGMLTMPGGARDSGGFSYHHTSLLQPSKAFGGAAFAHFDQHVSAATLDLTVSDELLRTAQELIGLQSEDGAIHGSYENRPVGSGDIQYTYQAVQTWRQAFTRTADDRWLAPLRKAEGWLQNNAKAFSKAPPQYTQDLSYAILGLLEAGAGQSERALQTLRGELLERQNVDGGWGFRTKQGSNAFATGQALYALRAAGMTDSDRAVKKGTSWLISNQHKNGGWGAGGSGKAEAMWAVMGLVSIDVLSIEVAGLEDGQLLETGTTIGARSFDNQGHGVRRASIYLDDVLVASACGSEVSQALDVDNLEDGLHYVDVIAENGKGKKARRRLGFYTGDHYLTEVGSRFDGKGTVLSARNLGATGGGEVEVELFEVTNDGKRGKPVFKTTVSKKSGPVEYVWDGKDAKGQALDNGRFQAELRYKKEGKVVQNVEHTFTHDSLERQKARWAEVQGKLDLGGMGAASNAEVELVDEEGNVLQRARSNKGGNYRFKNIGKGKYKVRVKKKGYKQVEMDFDAEPGAAPAEASAQMSAQ